MDRTQSEANWAPSSYDNAPLPPHPPFMKLLEMLETVVKHIINSATSGCTASFFRVLHYCRLLYVCIVVYVISYVFLCSAQLPLQT